MCLPEVERGKKEAEFDFEMKELVLCLLTEEIKNKFTRMCCDPVFRG